jgi:hypothetical protein
MHTRVATWSVSMRADLCFACRTEFSTHAACACIGTIRTNTPTKLTFAWCHDHVVCGTKSAHEGTPSGMLFNEQHGQEFIFFMVAAP